MSWPPVQGVIRLSPEGRRGVGSVHASTGGTCSQERHAAELELSSLTVRRCFYLEGATLQRWVGFFSPRPQGLTFLWAPLRPRLDELIGARFRFLASPDPPPRGNLQTEARFNSRITHLRRDVAKRPEGKVQEHVLAGDDVQVKP